MDRKTVEMREAARLLALVEAERRYFQEILANVPAGVAVIASDLSFVAVNRKFRLMFGLRAEDASRLSLEAVAGGEDVRTAIREAIETGTARQVAGAVLLGGATERRATLTVQPLAGWSEETGREAVLLVEEREAEAPDAGAARTGEVPALLWERDPKTLDFVWIGGSPDARLGFSEQQWLSRDFHLRRLHPRDRAWMDEYYAKAASRPGPGACEFRGVRFDGRQVWLRDYFQVIPAPDGQPARIVGLTVDAGEQNARRAMTIQAEKMAAIGRLTGRIAHECKSLVAALARYGGEFLSTLPADHPARKGAEELAPPTERLLALTAELMPLTRLPALPMQRVELNGLLTALKDELGGALGPDVRAEFELGEEATVIANAEALSNSIREIAEQIREWLSGGGRILISAAPAEFNEACAAPGEGARPRRYMRVTLSSREVELDHETRSGLFEPGFAGRLGRKGLTGAYQAVRAMGGDALIADGPGGGTEFSIYLQRAQGEPAAGAVNHEETPRPRTILVVEDEPGIKALLRKVLQKQGYTVIEASGGEEAVRVADDHKGPIHLLVTDVVMPRINGYELAYRLRTTRPYLRVLFVSAYGAHDLGAYGSAPSGAAFLQKPFSLAALAERAKALLAEGAASFQAWAI
ncbi:MAG: response regulator [Bryobacteraceae bacterium]|nr:response regulator [Bryobacteraceae bacterium]